MRRQHFKLVLMWHVASWLAQRRQVEGMKHAYGNFYQTRTLEKTLCLNLIIVLGLAVPAILEAIGAGRDL